MNYSLSLFWAQETSLRRGGRGLRRLGRHRIGEMQYAETRSRANMLRAGDREKWVQWDIQSKIFMLLHSFWILCSALLVVYFLFDSKLPLFDCENCRSYIFRQRSLLERKCFVCWSISALFQGSKDQRSLSPARFTSRAFQMFVSFQSCCTIVCR